MVSPYALGVRMRTKDSVARHHIRTLLVAFDLLTKCFQFLPFMKTRRKLVFDQCAEIAGGSLPIITLATGFSGLVMTSEIAWHMDFALSNVSMIPGFTGQFVLRELGIAVPALLIVSKVGASLTAELASMKITEQLDAYRLLRMNVVQYHIFPRWIGTIFATVVLTLFSVTITLGIALLTAVSKYHFNALEYVNTLRQFINFADLACAMTKALVFGVLIPPIACAYGIRCEGGAQGVGQATTDSVVSATLAVIVADFIVTSFFAAAFR
jgi:phospholipid/cholesterol/gamma-HCH transport system permease protein